MADKGFHEYILHEVLYDIEGISSRAMFGGYGIYKDGLIFALIADGKLYFKVGQSNIEDYKRYESKPFVYEMGDHKSTTMSYWELPESVMEDRVELREWIEKAVHVSREAKRKR